MKNYPYLLILLLLFMNCNLKKETAPKQKNIYDFKYKLDKPDATFELPFALMEISGLSLSKNKQYLLAINDEEGKIFQINKANGKVVKEVLFAQNGDYEGIEQVGNQVFVIKQNGTLFEIEDMSRAATTTIEHNTPLHSEHDIEGLGYDAINNRLLLAAKGKSGLKKHKKQQRAIFSYDLDKMKLKKKPIYRIDRKKIRSYIEVNAHRMHRDLDLSAFDKTSSDFAPSAIAVHPQTQAIYILSSVGKLLLIINRFGQIVHIESLKKSIYKQPEGLCFDTDGTMYLSTEGKKSNGKIFKIRLEN